jgi:hypothetical protein
MQKLKLIAIISAFSYLLYSCSGNNSPSTNKEAGDNSSTNSTSSDASFSVTIDGVPVSGGTIDDMQLQNTAFIYPPHDNVPQTVLFDLLSNKKGDDFYVMRFSLPNKEGEYHATSDNYSQYHTSVTLDLNLRSSNNFARYNQDSFTVTINKMTSSRISGTFSGVLKLSPDTRSQSYKSKVTILDGKFDIPFSTGKVRPE